MYCRKCGSSNPDEAIYCKDCGIRMTQETISSNKLNDTNQSQQKEKSTNLKRIAASEIDLKIVNNQRISRKNYIVGYILLFLFVFIVAFLSEFLFGSSSSTNNNYSPISSVIVGIAYLVFLFFGLTMSVRRLHDLNKSGWYLLINLIPIVNLIFTFYIFLSSGDKGTNKYGDIPPNKIDLKYILGL